MKINFNNARTATKNFFKPNLIEHIPGEKRVYKSLFGTETTYTLTSRPLSTESYLRGTKVQAIILNYMPSDMYMKGVRCNALSADTPITETFFTKSKQYLFGLFDGKTKTIGTYNIADRAVLRGEMEENIFGINDGFHISKYLYGDNLEILASKNLVHIKK